jgi:molybdopterin-guanine dinucleotide biosynthesis protein B
MKVKHYTLLSYTYNMAAMKNPSVVGIYGESNIGKTTLIQDLIKRLIKDKFKVATIKITDKKIGIDTEEKDTWKHAQAGSTLVVFSSPLETDFLFKENQNIDQILQNIKSLGEFDIVLVEGANDQNTPKIRIGNIAKRNNTIYTYKGNFEELINTIKQN